MNLQSDLAISVTGTAPASSSASSHWLHLTLDADDDAKAEITKKQLADWLDSTFGITDHCTDQRASDAFKPHDPIDTAEKRLQAALSGSKCSESAQKLGLHGRCSLERRAGFSIKKTVYVHWSDIHTIADSYSFKTTSDLSPSGPQRSSATVKITIDFTDADEAPVYRYAEAAEVEKLWLRKKPAWLGDVLIGKARTDSSKIGIGWSRGRVLLSQPVSGRLVVYLPIKFDVWTVLITGTIIGSKRSYNAKAYAFHDLLPEPASVLLSEEEESPEEGDDCTLCGGEDTAIPDDSYTTDPDTGDVVIIDSGSGTTVVNPCQKRIDWEIRNRCGGDLVDSGTRYEPTPCPDKHVKEVTYTSQGTPEGAVWTAEEYEAECCYPPVSPVCLPCKQIVSNYSGGAPVQPSEQYWRDRYSGQAVEFVRIKPENGCGTRIDEFIAGDGCKDPCDGVSALVWDADNPDIIAPNSSVDLELTGGNYPELPITWEITGGGGYSFVPLPEVVVKIIGGLAARLYSGAVPCGTAEITVTDGCSDAAGEVEPTNKITWQTESSIINYGVSKVIYTSGGLTTRTYTLTGADVSEVYFYGNLQTITTTATNIRVYVASNICGNRNVTLTVEDGCTSAAHGITAVAKLPLSWQTESSSINYGESKVIYTSGGLTTRTYTLTGADVSEVYFYGNVQTITTTATNIRVYVSAGAPYNTTATLTVDDGCATPPPQHLITTPGS